MPIRTRSFSRLTGRFALQEQALKNAHLEGEAPAELIASAEELSRLNLVPFNPAVRLWAAFDSVFQGAHGWVSFEDSLSLQTGDSAERRGQATPPRVGKSNRIADFVGEIRLRV